MTRQEHGSLHHKDGRGCTVVPRKPYFDTFRGVKQSSPAVSCTFLSCLALYVSIGVDRFAPFCGKPGAPMVLELLQSSC